MECGSGIGWGHEPSLDPPLGDIGGDPVQPQGGHGASLVEEVSLIDKYENEQKFGKNKLSYAYHIVYRSIERTLKVEEIEPLQEKIIAETKKQFSAEIR